MHLLRPYLSQKGPLMREPAHAAIRRVDTNQPCTEETKSGPWPWWETKEKSTYLKGAIHVDSREKSAEALQYKHIAHHACEGRGRGSVGARGCSVLDD